MAGVNYVAPASSSTAFVRITDTHHTGAGDTAAGGGALNARDVTAHISNATDLTSSFSISRPTGALADTRVTWEIVEFIGDPGTDNEAYGRHKAFLNLEYGSKQRANLYDTTFYTVIPLPLILGTFAFLMVSSMLLTWLYYRRTSRRQTIDDEAVPLYVRTDVSTVHQDHDINLKSN